MEYRSRIATFLVPEAELSLKMIFDNLRNFITGALIVTVGLYFAIKGAQAFAEASDTRKSNDGFDAIQLATLAEKVFATSFGIVAFIAGTGLTVLAFAQLFELLKLPIGKTTAYSAQLNRRDSFVRSALQIFLLLLPLSVWCFLFAYALYTYVNLNK